MNDPRSAGRFERRLAVAAYEAGTNAPRVLEEFSAEINNVLYGASSAANEFVDWLERCVGDFVQDPFDPFACMTDLAMKETVRLYGPLGLTLNDLRDRVPATMWWTNEPKGTLHYAAGIRAITETGQRGKGVVSLLICPDCFDRDCAFALSYVLFHEYICHAARIALGGPPPASLLSPFCEGWMDYIALSSHATALSSDANARCILDVHGHLEGARRLHDDRHTTGTGSPRLVGRDAVRRLCEYADIPSRSIHVWNRSFELNGSKIAEGILDRFALDVDWIIDHEPAAIQLVDVLSDRSLSPVEIVERVRHLASQ